MKTKLLSKKMSPDAPEGGSNTTPSVTHTANIPAADMDFLSVAEAVGTKWAITPAITLVYKNVNDYNTDVADYRAALTERTAVGSARPSQTNTMTEYDRQINAGVKEVKTYIDKKFKKANGPANYPRYGIIKIGGGYQMSPDRDLRKEALGQMVFSIDNDGFGTEEFGTAFWTDMRTKYLNGFATVNNIDSVVTTGVSTKNQLKKTIKEVMTSLRFVIRGNYPNTYKNELRAWGWQKEDY